MGSYRTATTLLLSGFAAAAAALCCATALPANAAPAAAPGAPVDFNRDVRPILSGTCFKCHGIDEGSRKGKFRLDDRDAALKGGSSDEPGIVPGKPGESEIIRRILTDDEDELMPPPASKIVLTAAQKETLRRWVEQGAVYQPHWSFVAPKRAALPAVKEVDWSRNAIDRFVLGRLEAEGLAPSPEADRHTLIRRVSLDLIGLPPTPAEVDAFVNDASPDAYERLVDRLLASPKYGERWARRWLDLARYADTNGYEKDRQRTIWPYRDWVIHALNADMPFDRFTVEQLAGDMLPKATRDQLVATGFHRNTMLNEEGGIDPLEFRYHAVVDRVGTTGTAWLGLTVACAQCHTHKYDPILHTEYFGLMAFFNNADEPGLELTADADEAKRKAIETTVEGMTAKLPDAFPVAGVRWETPAARVVAVGSKAESFPDGSWRFTGAAPERDVYTFTFDAAAGDVDRVRVETLKDGAAGPGRTPHGNFVLSEVVATVEPKDAAGAYGAPQDVKLTRAEADVAQKDFPAAHAIDGKPQTGWAIADPKGIKERTITLFPAKPISLPHGGRFTVRLEQNYGQQHTIGRLRLSVASPAKDDGRPVEVRRKEALDRAFAKWEQEQSAKAVQWTVLRPAEMKSSTPHLALLDDGSVLGSGDVSKSDTYDLTFRDAPAGVTAVRIEALPHESLPARGPGLCYYEGPGGDFSLSELTLTAGGADAPAKFARAAHSYAAGGNTAATAIDGNPQTGWMVAGGQGKPHVAVFTLAEPVTSASGELKLRMLFERHFASALGRFRVSVTTDARATTVATPAALPPEVEAALATPSGDRSQAQRDTIFRHFLGVAPELADARKKIDAIRNTAPKPVTTLVLRERPAGQDRQTHRHNRGEFLQPKEPVRPGVPAVLPPLPAGQPRDRLTFARWLVSRDNPLTARVTVNRQWAAFFGRGLVRTTEDFGLQGESPSHPELLDWLAVEFMDGQHWSLKQLHRLIVTSATYRQSSRVEPALLARDPQNVLLARGPRVRLEAEIVRDAALRASGLLSDKIGGPSVFPPQPASVTTEGTYGAFTWNASTGEDRYRRSLYTFAKRTAPFAMYNTFDAPTGEACVARREVSNTPLQALTLLNDTVFLEAAQAMGEAAASSGAPDEARVMDLFRRVVVRPPEAAEVEMLTAFAQRQRERFAAKELDAAKVAGNAEGDAVERATWTTVARAVLNLDEAVVKD